jgi:cytochrome c553
MRPTRAMGGLLSIALCATLATAADRPAKHHSFEAELLYERVDLDGDGAISREEWLRFADYTPRMRGNPELANQNFNRIDANKDGAVSRAEYLPVAAMQLAAAAQAEKPAAPLMPETAAPQVPLKADGPITPAQLSFFEAKIRPVLIENCYKCHSASAEKIKGNFVLDTREGIRKGGDLGPAVVPGNIDESLLIMAVRYQDDDLKMPPKNKLSDEAIADLERWVAMGAPDPRDGKTPAVAKGIDIEARRTFWAFQPPRATAPPAVNDEAWPRSDIDRFLLARLEAKGIKPVADADRYTLIRRVYFDLIGLPPTPEEVEAFVADESPAALETVVDRLLARPQFGERWGRHWLDVARYAESSGKQVNYNYPNAWRYRDYVFNAFNADKPFDGFIKEQVAGDLLPACDPHQRATQIVATGFLAVGPKPHVERSSVQFQLDMADEQIDVTTQAFLGLTVACARCHDHKFDPIPSRDYYAMAGIFNSSQTCYGTLRIVQNQNPSRLIRLPADSGQPAGLEKLTDAGRKRLETQIEEYRQAYEPHKKSGKAFLVLPIIRAGIRMQMFQSQLESYEADGTPRLLAMGMLDRDEPRDSPLYQRGELDKPGEVVPRGVVQVVNRKVPTITEGSGRLELAEWLASRDNPLTARVLVNRVWLHLFGRGLVPTPDNFGTAGQPPSHPELLDQLAVSFMDHGWSVKALIRQIVLSRAYQLDSRFDARNFELDPDDVLVWRMSKRRLEGEALRDAMLAISGQLDRSKIQGSVVARSGEGYSNIALLASVAEAQGNMPSVYLGVLRANFLEALALFDFPDPSLVSSQRASTTVPAQGLYLLNSPFVMRNSEAAARQLQAAGECGCPCEQIQRAYLQVFGRPASPREELAAEAFLASCTPASTNDPAQAEAAQRSALAALYQALFASADFLYRS